MKEKAQKRHKENLSKLSDKQEIKDENYVHKNRLSNAKLELESGDGTESASIPMDQVKTYKIEDAMTINLKTGADGETHYVKLTASISMDSKNDGYKTYGELH